MDLYSSEKLFSVSDLLSRGVLGFITTNIVQHQIMELMYEAKIQFPSHLRMSFRDLTPEINDLIQQTMTNQGRVGVISRHTTYGLTVNEFDEHKLLSDYEKFLLNLVPEDPRSTWVTAGNYQYPIGDYGHACMDNLLRDPDEMDLDFNAGRHLRSSLFTKSAIWLPYKESSVVLGRFQKIVGIEFDGRDGSGINPERIRTLGVYVYPSEKVINLGTKTLS